MKTSIRSIRYALDKFKHPLPLSLSPPKQTQTNKKQTKDLFGFFVILAFLLAVTATLLSAVLYGHSNYLGKDDMRWFIDEYKRWIGLPLKFMNLAVLMMLCSAEIIIKGLYGDIVQYVGIIAGGLCLLGLGYTHYRMQGKVLKKIDDMYAKKRLAADE